MKCGCAVGISWLWYHIHDAVTLLSSGCDTGCGIYVLKLFLAGQRFSPNQEAIAAVEEYFADLTKNHYRDGIIALEHRWNKCISLKGGYVEK
jgi:hypothetical protein